MGVEEEGDEKKNLRGGRRENFQDSILVPGLQLRLIRWEATDYSLPAACDGLTSFRGDICWGGGKELMA